MLSDDFLSRLDQLSLRMRQPASGGSGGLRRSKALGSSVEFSDFREYTPGDDLRRVDWNAFARFDRLFLKLFMEEQEQRVHLVVDSSASMNFGVPSKWECARKLAQALCYLSLCGSDTVVLYTLSADGEKHSRPLRGRYAYPEAASFLEAQQPRGQASLNRLLPRLPLSPGRGVTVLLSDFLVEDGYEKGLQSLHYRKQETTALQIWSREEWEPTLEGTVELKDSETGEKLNLSMSYPLLARYREQSRAYAEKVHDFCLKNGTAHRLLLPREDFEGQMLEELSRAGLIG